MMFLAGFGTCFIIVAIIVAINIYLAIKNAP